MKTKQSRLVVLILVTGLLLTGCGPNTSPTDNNAQLTLAMQEVQSTLTQIAVETLIPSEEPTFTPTVIPPTNTPLPEPTATNTPMPTVQPPTSTPLPTLTSLPPEVVSEVRINFETQGTDIFVVGMVKANSTQRYVLKGMEGQLLDITYTAAQESSLSVVGRDGTEISLIGDSGHVRGYLPSTQDWLVDIHAAGSNIDFALILMIPERVNLGLGVNDIVLTGYVRPNKVYNYIVSGQSGQVLTVTVKPEGNLGISIWGVDGTVLMNVLDETNTYVGTLPGSQDWIISVHNSAEWHARNYTIWLNIQ